MCDSHIKQEVTQSRDQILVLSNRDPTLNRPLDVFQCDHKRQNYIFKEEENIMLQCHTQTKIHCNVFTKTFSQPCLQENPACSEVALINPDVTDSYPVKVFPQQFSDTRIKNVSTACFLGLEIILIFLLPNKSVSCDLQGILNPGINHGNQS